ncbi:MAG: hypothetical protein M3R61_17345 [Chloroflexota bacterium]|nr:hypothetical protein [Chloroflexota bacterium]
MPIQQWTEQEIVDLKQMYPNDSISFAKMEQHFGRRRGTIKQHARRLGLRRPKLVWNEQDIAELAWMYVDEDVSRAQMVQRFGCTWRIICHKASALKLRRPRPNTRQVKRDYFKIIDTDEKAYWLGFLAADGAIYGNDRQYSVTLDLQQDDLHWLERFRDTIAPDATITTHGIRSCSVSIGSKEMYQDLIALGVGPRKSNTLAWPRVPESFAIPFLLGYFDGDGSFIRRKDRDAWQWMLLGTYPFLCVAREIIQAQGHIILREPVQAHKGRSPFLFRINASHDRAIAIDRILNASGLGMPRKHLPELLTMDN